MGFFFSKNGHTVSSQGGGVSGGFGGEMGFKFHLRLGNSAIQTPLPGWHKRLAPTKHCCTCAVKHVCTDTSGVESTQAPMSSTQHQDKPYPPPSVLLLHQPSSGNSGQGEGWAEWAAGQNWEGAKLGYCPYIVGVDQSSP